MACEGLLTTDILFDCDNAPKGGIEVNVLLFNKEQIDISALTYDAGNKLLMTNFQLLSGNTGILLKGVKQVQGLSNELVKKETSIDAFKHIFSGVVLTPSVANRLQLQSLSEGGSIVAMVELKWKGAGNTEAFVIGGIDAGLELNVLTWSTQENDGTIAFELSSVDGFEEPKQVLTLLETDYTTTKAAFDAKFVQI